MKTKLKFRYKPIINSWTVGSISSVILILISLTRLFIDLFNTEYISYFEIAWQDTFMRNTFEAEVKPVIGLIYFCALLICLYLLKVYLSIKIIEGSDEHHDMFFNMVYVPFQKFEWLLRLLIVLYLFLGISGHEWFVERINVQGFIERYLSNSNPNNNYSFVSNVNQFMPLTNILIYSISIYILLLIYCIHLYIGLFFSRFIWFIRKNWKWFDSKFSSKSYWDNPEHKVKKYFYYYNKRFFFPNALGVVLLSLIMIVSCINMSSTLFTISLGILALLNVIIIGRGFFKRHNHLNSLVGSFISLFFKKRDLKGNLYLGLIYATKQ